MSKADAATDIQSWFVDSSTYEQMLATAGGEQEARNPNLSTSSNPNPSSNPDYDLYDEQAACNQLGTMLAELQAKGLAD